VSASKHLTLTYSYTGLSKTIVTTVELYSGEYDAAKSYSAKVLWDTGATISAITPRIAEKLGLVFVNNMTIVGANSTSQVNTTIVSIAFPNGLRIQDCPVVICDIDPRVDMLLGMDVITAGDFAISNGDAQTTFSFASPPFHKKIDFSTHADEE
jgi:predicted aspartyl protease